MNSTPQPAWHLPLRVEDIEKVIPHCYPFLLIDKVDELEVGQSIKARKNVSANEAYFQGHFPYFRVMPGVLIVECLAQAGAILASLSEEKMKTACIFLPVLNRHVLKLRCDRETLWF